MFQHLRLHHRVEQYLVRSFDCSQHVHTFHQVGHAYIVVSLCLRLASLQQFLVQQPVGMLWIEHDVVRIVRVGMNPDGILATFEHTAQDGSQRTGTQLCVSHRQHVSHQRRVGHIPVQVLCSPRRVEPTLVQVLVGLGLRNVRMGLHTLLKMLPHVQYDTFVVPPVDIMLFGLFEILFPSVHRFLFYSIDAFRAQMSSDIDQTAHHHVADKQPLASQYQPVVLES